jgi:hypothetical protein
MSRSITLSYRLHPDAPDNYIEIPAPYYLLGGQLSSISFWSNPRIKEIGIERLAILGECDPVYFFGWEEMPLLAREIALLSQHLPSINYTLEIKAQVLAHLTYCYHLLIETAPPSSFPIFGIG